MRHYEIYGSHEALQLANKYMSFLLFMQKPEGSFYYLLGFDRRFIRQYRDWFNRSRYHIGVKAFPVELYSVTLES